MKNKIKIAVFTCLISMCINTLAQSPQFVWAKQIGTNYATYSKSLAVDASGNTYTLGHFYKTVDFDPGVGVTELTPHSINGDVFIIKLDANSNFIWAKQIGGEGTYGLKGNSLKLGTSGNIYVTGVYTGTVDFDPGEGTSNYTSSGEDIFILKLDNNGSFVWAKSIGNSSTDRGLTITVDSSENVYTTGFFFGTVDFDPNLDISNLSSSGLSDIFVLKLDTGGNFIWAKRMGGTVYDYGFSVAVDNAGSVYTAGYFNGTADFDPGTATYNLTSNGNSDIFISKLDSNGDFVWAKSLGGSDADMPNSIAVDPSGNILTTGYFRVVADFDPGTGVTNLTSNGGTDIFILKLDPDGNFSWVKQMGGSAEDFAYELKIDAAGNIFTTGYFWGTADFDPGVGVFNLTPVARRDCFISVLNSNGEYIWAHGFGDIYEDDGYSIAPDNAGNVYTTGGFYQTVDFDPGAGVYNLSSGNYYNMFLLKLYFPTLGISEFDKHYKLNVYPNPTTNMVEIDLLNMVEEGTIKVLNLQGKELLHTTINKTSKVKIELNQPPGIYFIDIRTPEGQKISKLILE